MSMRWSEYIAPKTLAKLDEYRRAKKAETGKTVQRQTAINQLLESALEGVVPEMPLEQRVAELEKAVSGLLSREHGQAVYRSSQDSNIS